MEFIKKHAVLVVAGILFFHFILSLLVSSQESMIFDEKAHIPAGYSYVRYGDMRLNPEHPPLLKDLAGLFLLPLGLEFPLASTEWQTGVNEQWTVGDMFVNCSRPEVACNDADTVLFFSRIPIIIISVLLGIALFVWTKELGGTLAGVFAVALYAFDPNIIAHNHYVTTDIGIAAFIFFSFYFFVRFLKYPNGRNILLSGLFLGLAQLVKFSAVLLFPTFGLFVILYALTREQNPADTRSNALFKTRLLFKYLLKFTASVVICFMVIWVVYAINTMNMPGEKIAILADHMLAQKNQFANLAHDLVVYCSQNALLKPFSEYLLGFFKVFSRVVGGNTHYFLGTVTEDASPWYFPVVFVLKETLPFLFLLLFTSCYGLYRIGKSLIEEKAKYGLMKTLCHSFQHRVAQYLALFFILFYGYISIAGNLDIGLRHLFPIMPLFYMLIAKALFDFYKRSQDEPGTKKILTVLLGLITFAIVAIPIWSYPSYLSYFNAITGGHLNGYKYVTDSNYDWGQDLIHLKNFVTEHNDCVAGKSFLPRCNMALLSYPPIDKIRVDYFGGGSPAYYLEDKYIPWYASRDQEPGWYAISTFFYQENLYKKKLPGEKDYSWLKDKTPIARAGDNFFIYYFPPQ